MRKMIKDRIVTDDGWQVVRGELDDQGQLDENTLQALAGQDVIVPLSAWQQQRELLSGHTGKVAVWLDSNELPESIAEDLPELPLVALNFPEFKDGRPFTSARELRQRYGYSGEIRAIGDVARDQLFYMARCGFSSFELREDQDPEQALEAFNDFRDAYQPAIDQPLPLFRRR